jgi:hypothetical protein
MLEIAMALIVGFALARGNRVNRFTSAPGERAVNWPAAVSAAACATSGHSLFTAAGIVAVQRIANQS